MDSSKHYTTSEAYLQRLFTMFAKTEIHPRAYIESLIPHNLQHARRVATRRGRGWRKEVRESITAVKAAKSILKTMPLMVAVLMLTACNTVDFFTGVPAKNTCTLDTAIRADSVRNDTTTVAVIYVCPGNVR